MIRVESGDGAPVMTGVMPNRLGARYEANHALRGDEPQPA
jgi:hypothetical protein